MRALSAAGAGSLPFVPPGATLTASGRQALSLVAQELRVRGITEVLAPVYHCPTMIEPLQLEGLHVELVAVGEDLLLDAGALRHSLDSAHRGTRPCAVLHSETEAHLAGPDLAAALATARAGGHILVRDETHSFLDTWGQGPGRSPDAPAAEFRVASLRKWLPLPDGAWVTGIRPRELPRREIDRAVTAAGLAALTAAADGGAGEGSFAVGELWRRAEGLVDGAAQPAAMSPHARALLAALDAGEFVRRHRAAGSPLPYHWERPHNLPPHLSWPEQDARAPRRPPIGSAERT